MYPLLLYNITMLDLSLLQRLRINVTHHDLDTFLLHWCLVVCGGTHSHQGVHTIRLQILHIKTHFKHSMSPWLPRLLKENE